MMIVDDFGKKEYRLFFMTEDDEDRFFDFPERSESRCRCRRLGSDPR
jgi:hypothetical protein